MRTSMLVGFFVGVLALPFAAPATATTNEPVSTQVTNAVTQANVKVLGDAPAMTIGNVYQAMYHSIGQAMNAAPQRVQHAQTLTSQGLQQIYPTATPRSTSSKQSSRAKVFRSIDAIAKRLQECGSDCVVNVHVHVLPEGSALAPSQAANTDQKCDTGDFQIAMTDLPASPEPSAAELLTTCIIARMEQHTDVAVQGFTTVIPDGDDRLARWQDSSVTSIDLLVQRVL